MEESHVLSQFFFKLTCIEQVYNSLHFLLTLIVQQLTLIYYSITFIFEVSEKQKASPAKNILESKKLIHDFKLEEFKISPKHTDEHINFPLEGAIILITDIIESTRLYNENPLKMKFYLDLHKATVKSLLKKNSGHVVGEEGDSFYLAFQHIRQALRFTREFIGQHRDNITYFKVRMALAKGNLCVRNIYGYKVYGRPLDEAIQRFEHNPGNKICLSRKMALKYNLLIESNLCIH